MARLAGRSPEREHILPHDDFRRVGRWPKTLPRLAFGEARLAGHFGVPSNPGRSRWF